MIEIGSTSCSAKYLCFPHRCTSDIPNVYAHKTTRVDNDAPIYPVRDVQPTVCAQRGEVVRRDCFCFACALEDEELWEDSNGFEEDGERPGYFGDRVGVVE